MLLKQHTHPQTKVAATAKKTAPWNVGKKLVPTPPKAPPPTHLKRAAAQEVTTKPLHNEHDFSFSASGPRQVGRHELPPPPPPPPSRASHQAHDRHAAASSSTDRRPKKVQRAGWFEKCQNMAKAVLTHDKPAAATMAHTLQESWFRRAQQLAEAIVKDDGSAQALAEDFYCGEAL